MHRINDIFIVDKIRSARIVIKNQIDGTRHYCTEVNGLETGNTFYNLAAVAKELDRIENMMREAKEIP